MGVLQVPSLLVALKEAGRLHLDLGLVKKQTTHSIYALALGIPLFFQKVIKSKHHLTGDRRWTVGFRFPERIAQIKLCFSRKSPRALGKLGAAVGMRELLIKEVRVCWRLGKMHRSIHFLELARWSHIVRVTNFRF
ncbi:MAG: hypothetical protein L3J37_08705 [Rhodobacteraceae bacterium]|nr:hypothetical protein [Paracoccaceae bacterium]